MNKITFFMPIIRFEWPQTYKGVTKEGVLIGKNMMWGNKVSQPKVANMGIFLC